MIRSDQVLQTAAMIQEQHLDVRAVTFAAYVLTSTGTPTGSNCRTSVWGNLRRMRSMAPSGRTGSVRVTWHHAGSAAPQPFIAIETRFGPSS